MASSSDTESESGVSTQADEAINFAFEMGSRILGERAQDSDPPAGCSLPDVFQAIEALQSVELEGMEDVSYITLCVE